MIGNRSVFEAELVKFGQAFDVDQARIGNLRSAETELLEPAQGFDLDQARVGDIHLETRTTEVTHCSEL